MHESTTGAELSVSAIINVPIEKIDLPEWCFSLSEAEYQSCSPAHCSAGVTIAPDGRRMAINVEILGGNPMVQHWVEDVSKPDKLRLVSESDVFTPTGRIKVNVVWEFLVKRIDDDSCELINTVHSTATPELLESLARQGIPREALRASSKPVSEAHNRQETPFFAKSIEKYTLIRK
jgi:hypothetical protein